MPTGYVDLDKRQGGGDPNILKLQDGANKVRPLDNLVAGWRQHAIEHPSDTEQFAAAVCPGSRTCPLDRKPVDAEGKQRFPISRRYAANVWDYVSNSVKVLVAGPQVFDKFKAAAQVGVEPMQCDWMIVKQGKGRNTEYDVINMGPTPFTAAQIAPEHLHDVTKYEQPASPEAIFEILEKFGIDYDALEIPSYSYDDALAFIMPYTKHKGLTIEQLVATDLDYAKWLYGTKLETGQFGDPVFLAIQTVFENMDIAPKLEEAINLLPKPEPDQPAQQTQTHTATIVPPVTDTKDQSLPGAKVTGEVPEGMTKLIAQDGTEVVVPTVAVDAMLATGFSLPEPEPEPAAAAESNSLSVTVLATGQTMELPLAAALAMIESGAAVPAQANSESAPPALPLPDESVGIEVAGNVMQLPFAQAAQIVDSGSGAFTDLSLVETYKAHRERAAAQPDPSATQPNGSASTPPAATPSSDEVAEKPFACDECSKRFKTQGALTQHKNKEHKAAQPQASAVPAASNGGSLADQVKAKITGSKLAGDYSKLITIMKEETGTANFMEMSDEQLAKLDTRVDAELTKLALEG